MSVQTDPDAAKPRTMEEFATASGISRPTLSRYFADPASVRPASRERIEAAMRRFGYRPNLMAVNFNRKRPRTLGLLVPSLLDPFYAGLVQRIEKLASDAGYWTIVQNAHGDAAGEAKALATLGSLNVAGAILVPLGHASKPRSFREIARSVPTVLLDTRIEIDAPFVGTDNAKSIGLMVDYLHRSGGSPTYFDMPDVNRNARERREAYASAMDRLGLEPRIVAVGPVGWDFERVAFETASRLLASPGGPLATDTILCANDRIAFGLMAAATEAGLRIGRGEGAIRIAGHDDHPLSRYACPSLTTVARNPDLLARSALDALMSAISDAGAIASPPQLSASLIMRSSA